MVGSDTSRLPLRKRLSIRWNTKQFNGPHRDLRKIGTRPYPVLWLGFVVGQQLECQHRYAQVRGLQARNTCYCAHVEGEIKVHDGERESRLKDEPRKVDLFLEAMFCNEQAHAIILGATPGKDEVDLRSKSSNDLCEYWEVEPRLAVWLQSPNRTDHITALVRYPDFAAIGAPSGRVHID